MEPHAQFENHRACSNDQRRSPDRHSQIELLIELFTIQLRLRNRVATEESALPDFIAVPELGVPRGITGVNNFEAQSVLFDLLRGTISPTAPFFRGFTFCAL